MLLLALISNDINQVIRRDTINKRGNKKRENFYFGDYEYNKRAASLQSSCRRLLLQTKKAA